jgi:hypothetical protein
MEGIKPDVKRVCNYMTAILCMFTLALFAYSCSYKVAAYLGPFDKTQMYYGQFNRYSDSMRYDTVKKIFRSVKIGKDQAYYLVKAQDTAEHYFMIEANYFTRVAIILKGDSILLAPVFDRFGIDKLAIDSFKFFIPPRVRSKDTIRIIDDLNIQYGIHGFKKTNTIVNGRKLKNCLNIKIDENYLGTGEAYFGEVWLNRKYGVVKYRYSTGRLEQRQL